MGGDRGNLRWKTTVSVLRCGRAVAALHKTSVGRAAKAVLARVVRCTERGRLGGDPEN